MGMSINSLVFIPPKKSFKHKNLKFLTTHHNSKIPIIESTAFQTDQIILFSHGNAEDIYDSFEYCSSTLQRYVKINFIVYDYTGYSVNDTNFSPCEKFVYNDILTVYNYLVNVRKYKPNNIILLGRSLGTGPSCFLAEKYKVGGVILNSGFASILRVAFSLNLIFPFDLFCNIKRINNITAPITIIHSVDDEIVPFENAIDLCENCNDQALFDPLFIEGTTHNNIDRICDKFYDHINNFLEFVFGKRFDVIV